MCRSRIEVARGEFWDLDQDDSTRFTQLPPDRVFASDGGETLRSTREPRNHAIVLAAVVLEGDPKRLSVPIKL
jgi:hypothetical protein